VYAYLIDTGINLEHEEFGDRATCGAYFVESDCNDYNGHGTHCAGTLGGATYGVAKKVHLVAVKALDYAGKGSSTTVIAGIDFVIGEKKKHPSRKIVINMSVASPYYDPVNVAATNAVRAGIVVVVAAGNDNSDACSSSPASARGVITVGATMSNDYRSGFSNWGPCVDLFAPGSFITSAWIGSPYAVNVESGTSMATPHVAGVAALYLEEGKPPTNLIRDAVRGKVNDPQTGSPNRLVNTQRA
jgi:serine protease